MTDPTYLPSDTEITQQESDLALLLVLSDIRLPGDLRRALNVTELAMRLQHARPQAWYEADEVTRDDGTVHRYIRDLGISAYEFLREYLTFNPYLTQELRTFTGNAFAKNHVPYYPIEDWARAHFGDDVAEVLEWMYPDHEVPTTPGYAFMPLDYSGEVVALVTNQYPYTVGNVSIIRIVGIFNFHDSISGRGASDLLGYPGFALACQCESGDGDRTGVWMLLGEGMFENTWGFRSIDEYLDNCVMSEDRQLWCPACTSNVVAEIYR